MIWRREELHGPPPAPRRWERDGRRGASGARRGGGYGSGRRPTSPPGVISLGDRRWGIVARTNQRSNGTRRRHGDQGHVHQRRVAQLQWAVTDTMAYLSMADTGFWDTFKEATAAAKFMAAAKSSSDSPLVHDLAGDIKMGHDKEVTHDRADMAGEVAARVREAAGIVAAKAPAGSRRLQELHPRRRAGDRRGRQGRRRARGHGHQEPRGRAVGDVGGRGRPTRA